jgi:hypothetical protein
MKSKLKFYILVITFAVIVYTTLNSNESEVIPLNYDYVSIIQQLVC